MYKLLFILFIILVTAEYKQAKPSLSTWILLNADFNEKIVVNIYEQVHFWFQFEGKQPLNCL